MSAQLQRFRGHFLPFAMSSALVLALVGCSSSGSGSGVLNRAPVEDRGTALQKKTKSTSTGAAVATSGGSTATATANTVRPLGWENEGKPGYYTVKSGDTLIRIGLDNGQRWRDLVRWNQIENPDQIEVGQVLRVVPPEALASATPVAIAIPVPPIGSSSSSAPAASSASSTNAAAALPPPSTIAPPAVHSVASVAKPASDGAAKPLADNSGWVWPTQSITVLAPFEEGKNKGIDFAGKAGDPVFAAAAGEVVHAGSGLRGYGNLIIIKHSDMYITAYAHNQKLLVKEDQMVTKGQKIAEMGQSDTDRVKLHFEVRKQGKPVDPLLHLPKR